MELPTVMALDVGKLPDQLAPLALQLVALTEDHVNVAEWLVEIVDGDTPIVTEGPDSTDETLED